MPRLSAVGISGLQAGEDVKLQFSTTNAPASRLICWGTWSDYSHVDLVLPDGRLLGAIWGDGVCIHAPRDDYARVARFNADIPFAPYLEALTTQIGSGYDVMGVLGFPFRKDWQERDKWFCSELHAWAASHIGYPLLRFDHASRITPRDLMLSPLLTPA